jgi:mannose-6-phosphate isomerase-like protein (cupin superfamily)
VRIVPKPWRHEIIWAHTDRHAGKILHIAAGHALSVQYHQRKDETVYLLAGRLRYGVQRPGEPELHDVRLRDRYGREGTSAP